MLERTVGCREPGSLRRLLPGTQRSLTSRRALHSGFWHHSALELELPPLYAALLRAATAQDRDCDFRQHATPVMHAGFHLDFLHPIKTFGLLRQYTGWRVDRQDDQRKLPGPARGGRRLSTVSTENISAKEATVSAQDAPANILPAADQLDQDHVDDSLPADSPTKVMGRAKNSDYETSWELYSALDDLEKGKARRELIRYLSNSKRVVEAERILEVFEQLDEADKDTAARATAIRSYLRLRNLTDAIALYKDAINDCSFPAGAANILGYMVENSFWTQAINFWTEFHSLRSSHFPGTAYKIYRVIEGRSKLRNSALELAKHVDARIKSSSDPSKMVKFASQLVKKGLIDSASSGDRRCFDALLGIFQGWDIDLMTEYQTLLDRLLELNETKFAILCYRKAHYTHRIKFTRPTLHNMLTVFCKFHSVIGMQQIMDDFFRFYKHPSRFVYRKCMAEFASQGDAETVHALFKQHLARVKLNAKGITRPSDLAPILHAHAKRGELAEVIKYFDEIKTVHGLQPDVLCWNILINAHGKVEDPDGAFEVFEELVRLGVSVNEVTFGTIMGICATRGDIDRLVEIYRLSLSMNIETSASMIDCLVLAHLQNNRFEEAEKICEDALEMQLQGSKTRMWNYLIVAHGMRRDINKVNEILQRMSKAGLDYDQYTYGALMQALAMVGQSARAQSILNFIMVDAGIPRTSFHYAIVMGSYLATKNFNKVYILQKRMAERGVKLSASTKVLTIKASDQELFEFGTHKERGRRALQMFQEVLSTMDEKEIPDGPQKGIRLTPRHIAIPTMLYSYVIAVLGQSHQFESAEQLYEEFTKTLPVSERASPPLEALAAIMTAKAQSDDWEAVQEFWDLAVSKAKDQGAPLRSLNIPSSSDASSLDGFKIDASENEAPKIMSIHRLALQRCLSIYMNALAKQRRANYIPTVVNGLLKDGFLLDNRNWNEYIQILARNGHSKLAFDLCERKLMGNWTGWAGIRWHQPMRNRLPLELRIKRKQALHLRPTAHTFLYLTRAFLDLQDVSVESRLGQEIFDDVCKSCPTTTDAIKTMPRTDSPLERNILRDF